MGAQGHLGQRSIGSKKTIKGGVEALTSGQFIALWTERVNRFIARKVEPPTQLRAARQQGQEADEVGHD